MKALLLSLLLMVPLTSSAQWTEVKRLMNEADASPAARDSLLNRAYSTAMQSVRDQPSVAMERLWLANSAGRLAQTKGSREKLELSKIVKSQAEAAIQLDPNLAGAHMTLGAWHFYVADLSWIERNIAKMLYGKVPDASYAEAVKQLTLALRGPVDNPVECYYIRGMAYAALDDDVRALADYRSALGLPPRNAREREMQRKAKQALE
jgi:tetratricopeptide (TPR) repeat protein